jgi:hypothetical protein
VPNEAPKDESKPSGLFVFTILILALLATPQLRGSVRGCSSLRSSWIFSANSAVTASGLADDKRL